jgi:hypothetical protein
LLRVCLGRDWAVLRLHLANPGHFSFDHFTVCQFCPILHQYFDTENEENPVILQPEFNKTSKTKD